MEQVLNPTIKEYDIRSYEVNANNEIKPHALLHYFEDIAYIAAEEYGFGYSVTYPQGYGWFLLKYNIEIEKFPSAWEKIKVRTWPCEYRGIQCRREFEVYNANDERIGAISSLWVLIDINSKRIANARKLLTFPPLETKTATEATFEKIPEITEVTKEQTIVASYDDIDINQHVNNSNYIKWATKILDDEFLMQNSMKKIEILYKNEVKCGAKTISKVKIDNENNITTHVFIDEETNVESAQIKIEWKKRTN